MTAPLALYNEIDPEAADVLRALIDEGVIAPGHVDERSIKEIHPDELEPYTQVHFFAGGGLWSIAARMAGWPDSRPLWTGSCPCQPFSQAGRGRGVDDPRHLWPDLHRLVAARRPAVVVGEQVAGAAGYRWFDGVRADLESEGYAARAVDIPACAIDAPHQRNRLYWVATTAGGDGLLDHRVGAGLEGHAGDGDDQAGRTQQDRPVAAADGPGGSRFSPHEWIAGHDGRWRRRRPGARMLADGFPGRVGLWRIAGNAISPVLAAEVIGALMDTLPVE